MSKSRSFPSHRSPVLSTLTLAGTDPLSHVLNTREIMTGGFIMGSEYRQVMEVARTDAGYAPTAFCSVGIADSCGTNPSPPNADAVSDSNMRLAATGAEADEASMVRDL